MSQALDLWINGLLDCCNVRGEAIETAAVLLARSRASMSGQPSYRSFTNPLIHQSTNPLPARA